MSVRVVVIGSDIPALRPDARVVVRPSVLEALGYIRRAKPEIVLLSRELWRRGWARAVAVHSPESVVFPADAPPRAVA
jgi:hypothetical protein